MDPPDVTVEQCMTIDNDDLGIFLTLSTLIIVLQVLMLKHIFLKKIEHKPVRLILYV